VRLTTSLRTLASRAGPAGSSRDGWGLALYQGADVALVREPVAAADSALVRYLEAQGPASPLAVAHIRHATRGEPALANTQPFARELRGRMHVFAHNGDLPGIFQAEAFKPTGCGLVGQTDSEHAFCALLSRLGALRTAPAPSLEDRVAVLARFAAQLRELGPANFVYADGDALFAHGHRRIQPSGRIEPPGLWWLQRECPVGARPVDAAADAPPLREARSVLLVASIPLSDEPWQPLAEGELLVARAGRRVARARTARNEVQRSPPCGHDPASPGMLAPISR
jgi:glutamine amidotransferase